MQGHHPAAVRQESIEFLVGFIIPECGAPEVDHHHIGLLPDRVFRTAEDGRYFYMRGFGEQGGPLFLPRGVIVFAGSVILGTGDQHDIQVAQFLSDGGRDTGFHHRINFRLRSRGGCADRGRGDLSGGEKNEQVFEFIGAQLCVSFGHDGDRAGVHAFDLGSQHDGFLVGPFEDAKFFVTFRADQPGQHTAVFQGDDIADVIGIDRGVGVDDIAEDGGRIALDQIREVGADVSAFFPHGVASGAIRLDAVEEGFAALPVSTGQLGGGAGGRWLG